MMPPSVDQSPLPSVTGYERLNHLRLGSSLLPTKLISPWLGRPARTTPGPVNAVTRSGSPAAGEALHRRRRRRRRQGRPSDPEAADATE